MKKISFLVLSFLCCIHLSYAQSIETDPMVKTLREELNYNFTQLRGQQVPAYFMSLRMADEFKVHVESTFGAASSNEQHLRTVTPQVRLGNIELDNFKFVNQGTSDPNGRNTQGIRVPLDGKSLSAVRQAIWKETLSRYNIAQRNYSDAQSKMMTSAGHEDQAACFSAAPVELYYEDELPVSAYQVDKKAWEERLNAITRIFKENGQLESGNASADFTVLRTWFTTSEGTVVVQNRRTVRIMLSASIKAIDGMSCPLHQDFFAFTEDQLPSLEILTAAARDITNRLLALREAPVADPYTGPAILSGPASGVFFHEIFGHRLEGHRLKTGGETFKKKVGERILPEAFSVYCDPTLSQYGKTILNGHYLYDDEGVKARRVDNVVNGVLRNFLMSRVPLDGFPTSNGHGRTRDGNDPVSRQSNLIVETNKPYSEAQLRKMLVEEAKRQGKEYGYYFRTVTSGFTFTGEGNSLNSFNVSPVEVYRVYTDGRPDQLVRGVDLIGTPLSMFSNIAAAGDTSSTFTGECGAESGWVPVTATSPMIFVSQVETQRSKAQRQAPAIISQPELVDDANLANADEASIILKAMDDEMQRTKSMRYGNLPAPCFVDYRVARVHQTYISSSLGATVVCSDIPTRTLGSVNLLLGNDKFTSEVQAGQASNITLSNQVDYNDIRRQLWGASDEMYKYGVNSIASKQSYLMQHPRSEEEAAVPDIFMAEAKEHIAPSVLSSLPDCHSLQSLNDHLSAVFCDYPQLYDTEVHINYLAGDAYRITSEGIRLRLPMGNAIIEATAKTKCTDGSVVHEGWNHQFCLDGTLPDKTSLCAELRSFAEQLVAKREAKALSEYYCGPVMYEDEAATTAFASNVISPVLIAKRSIQEGSGLNSQMHEKRILDTKISITQLAGTDQYKGHPLFGSYSVDADGRTPQSLYVVENGILRNIICGRHPAVGCTTPTGNERFLDNVDQGLFTHASAGVLHITSSKTTPQSKMLSALASEAKKSGLDYAYIVRARNSALQLYRYDVKTGTETVLRTKEIPVATKSELLHITHISRDEQVSNFMLSNNNVSLIAPKSFIVENIEFNFMTPDAEPSFPIANPSER